MPIKIYDWRNCIMEVALGGVPIFIFYTLNNSPTIFRMKLESLIPNNEIQLLVAYYALLGLILLTLSLWLDFSQSVKSISFELISALISLFQILSGCLLFFAIHSMLNSAFNYTILFTIKYLGFHFATINLIVFVNSLKQKNRLHTC